MTKKLNIAIFHLAFVYSGGGERLVLEEAIGLSKLGHNVTLFAPIVDTKNCFPELLKQVSVKTLIPKLPTWLPDITLFSIVFACFWAPMQFWKYRAYDIYFGANQPGPWIAYMLSKINQKKYAIYLAQPTRLIHPRLIDQKAGLRIVDGVTLLPVLTFLFRPFIEWIDKKSIYMSPAIFSNGSYMKGVLDQVYGIESILCPAASHMHKALSAKEISSRFTGSITLGKIHIKKPYLFLGNRHFPQKKFEYAIDALDLLPIMPLVIAGKSTNYTKFLKKYAKRKNVYFAGLLSEKDLEKAYKHAAVYVYPSPQEDFGMGIVEAMSYSVPVVAWENAGPTGIITSGQDGLLAKPFEVADFAQQIQHLLSSKRLYATIARNARKTIEKDFIYEKHNRTISDGLLSLVSSS